MSKKIKILLIANEESTLYNFRREVISSFVKVSMQVIVCYPYGEHTDEMKKLGCELVDINVSRHGKNVLQDIKFYNTCKSLLRRYEPNVVLTYTVKPNIYGSLACNRVGIKYINNITGLGTVLQNDNMLSKLILFLQKKAYRNTSCVFFQNEANRKFMLEKGVIKNSTPTEVLPGSGVNLQKQCFEKYPGERATLKFAIISRIRKDKGYQELFEVAERINKNHPNTEFHVAGWYEEGELSDKLKELENRQIVKYYGSVSQDEVHDILTECDCLIHPSYHEGMANVILEAAATGRPVIASNIPGCIEGFDDGITGYSCEPQNVESLYDAIEKMINTPYEIRVEMGKKARNKMEQSFDRSLVAQTYIERIKSIV